MFSDVLIVARKGRGPHLECFGAISARRTEPDTVHLVSAALTPLGGDTARVRVVVERGATLRVRSVAAAVALPGLSSRESSAVWEVEVEGELDLDPEPMIVAGASHHVSTTRVALSDTARLRLRERVQIGRSSDTEGYWSGRLHADVGRRPLLRHRIEIGTGGVADDALGAPMACVSEFRYPEADFDASGTLLTLAGGGGLATWQGRRLEP